MGFIFVFGGKQFVLQRHTFERAERALKKLVSTSPHEFDDPPDVLAARGLVKTLAAASWRATVRDGDIVKLRGPEKAPPDALDSWPDAIVFTLGEFATTDSRLEMWTEGDPWVNSYYYMRSLGHCRRANWIPPAFKIKFSDVPRRVEYRPNLRVPVTLTLVPQRVRYDTSKVVVALEPIQIMAPAKLSLSQRTMKIGESQRATVTFGPSSFEAFCKKAEAHARARRKKSGFSLDWQCTRDWHSFRVEARHEFPKGVVRRGVPHPDAIQAQRGEFDFKMSAPR